MTLRIRGLRLWLGERLLVDRLDAVVAPGQVLAVTGPSGCGKSSLLAQLCGLLGPAFRGEGEVWLDDRALHALPTEDRRLGLLFQDDLLFPHFSVLENLLFALPAGPGPERRARAEQALAHAGLAGFGARRPHSLSGGQRARVALLRALLAQPGALLLDEPFARLDLPLRESMRSFVFGQLREHGMPCVLVTHDEADVPAGALRVHLGWQRPEGDFTPEG
jgi:putative thiamine transport system ATP-binding protein